MNDGWALPSNRAAHAGPAGTASGGTRFRLLGLGNLKRLEVRQLRPEACEGVLTDRHGRRETNDVDGFQRI